MYISTKISVRLSCTGYMNSGAAIIKKEGSQMKKILAIVLSFAMMISMAVVWSFADSGYSVDGILTVEGNQATLDVSVAVPDGAKLAGIQVDVAYNTD